MRWLADPSEPSVRQALVAAAPGLADARIEPRADIPGSDPEWWSNTAVVNGLFTLKFAWSEPAARRVIREARILETLAQVSDLPVPSLVGTSDEPAAFVTRLVAGTPLSFDAVPVPVPDRDAIAQQLGSFLARLHEPRVLEAVQGAVGLIAPHPQGTTDSIRKRLPPFLDPGRTRRVFEWCDWVDHIFATPSPQAVLVHGDLHGYNQVWRRSPWALRLVADFESCGPSDPEYDFRYFPPQEPSVELLLEIRRTYMGLTRRAIDTERVMAWHILTALGDALWRSEAGIPLPGGGTPATYVDDIDLKMTLLAAR